LRQEAEPSSADQEDAPSTSETTEAPVEAPAEAADGDGSGDKPSSTAALP
jgi:hypothetical protein